MNCCGSWPESRKSSQQAGCWRPVGEVQVLVVHHLLGHLVHQLHARWGRQGQVQVQVVHHLHAHLAGCGRQGGVQALENLPRGHELQPQLWRCLQPSTTTRRKFKIQNSYTLRLPYKCVHCSLLINITVYRSRNLDIKINNTTCGWLQIAQHVFYILNCYVAAESEGDRLRKVEWWYKTSQELRMLSRSLCVY